MACCWFDPEDASFMAKTLESLHNVTFSAIVLCCKDPTRTATALFASMQVAATFPVTPSIGQSMAERLLDRIRPGLVIVDDPASAVAISAFASGWRVALFGNDGALSVIAESRRSDVAAYHDNIAILLQTSGTTGEPKLVGLTRDNLQASYAGIAGALELSPDDRTLTLMPLTHIHGIVAVLGASLFAGGRVALLPPRDPAMFWEHVVTIRPTWLSMVPTLLHSILATAPAEKPEALNALRFIRTSSSALPPTLRAKAEAYFGVPVIEAYGMTEASHQMASATLETTTPGVVGQASASVEISIRDAQGADLPAGEIGEVCVRGPNVIQGYLWPVEANETAFFGDWLRTGDLGTLLADGQLQLVGRIKEQINRGGATLSPKDIEDAILEHPRIAEAVAFPVPHDTLGEEVAALVVCHPGQTPSQDQLLGDLTKTLDFEHCPKFIFFADELPKQASSGKVSRIEIAKTYATRTTAPAARIAAPDDRVHQIIQIAATILKQDEIDPDHSLFSYGLTSLQVFQLCHQIEQVSGVPLSPADVLVAPTCSQLARKTAAPRARKTADTGGTGTKVGPHLRAIATRHVAGGQNLATLIIGVPDNISLQELTKAWATVCEANPMLRARPVFDADDINIDIAATAPRVQQCETGMKMIAFAATPDALQKITQPPQNVMVHASWVTCAGDDHCIVVQISPFVADGYAHHTLIRQLNLALAGKPLPVSTAHLRLSQGQASMDDDLGAETIAPVQSGVPTDFVDITADLPSWLWTQVLQVAKNTGTTPFALGLAITSHLLERVAGRAFPVWLASQKRRNTHDFQAIANATQPRFVLQSCDGADLITHAKGLLSDVLSNSRSGEPIPHRDSTPVWFEIADEATTLSDMFGPDRGPLRALRIDPVGPGQPGMELSIDPAIDARPGLVKLRYDRNLLAPGRAKSLVDGFLSLLQNAVAAPQKPLKTLPVTGADVAVAHWPVVKAAKFDTITASFDQLCKHTPEAIAIRTETSEMDFAALHAVTRQIGDVLEWNITDRPLRLAAVAGHGPAATQSQIMVLAVFLAAQRSGAIFMPLAAQTSAAQVADDLGNLGFDLVIGLATDPRLEGIGARVDMHIPAFPDVVMRSLNPKQHPALPDHAEVIYASSGTTGVSKKIMSGADRFVDYFNGLLSAELITPAPSLAGANVSFDIWMYDTLFPLLCGQPVVFVPEERRTPDVLTKARELGARNLSLTPSVASIALHDDPQVFAQFDTLYLIGEPLSPNLREALCAAAPDTRLLNNYGTTETGVAATLQHIHAKNDGPVSVGKAVPGFDVLVCDPITLQAQLAGWPGEVTIVQPSITSTYLSAEQSKALLLRLPDGRVGQRTGDIGEISDDGTLVLSGRGDRQVQINGTRVELDTIEKIAEAHHDVTAAAAVFDPETDRIRLYFVAETAVTACMVHALRADLINQLPRAVRNMDLVQIADIPLGPTGKKRRDLISVDDRAVLSPDTGPAIPAGTVAADLAGIWAQVLPTDMATQLHLNSDFFDAGGTSLGLLRVAGLIRRTLDRDIPEDLLFANTGLAAQAKLLVPTPSRASGPELLTPRTLSRVDHTIICLPSGNRRTELAGMIAALDLPFSDVWVVRSAQTGGPLANSNEWQGLITQTADWIETAFAGKPVVLMGASFGGWMAWAIDIVLQSRGFAASTIISFDGPASHLNAKWPDIKEFVDRSLQRCAHYTPPRHLLFHRIENTSAHSNPRFGSEWTAAQDRNLTMKAVPTIEHTDFSTSVFVRSQKGVIDDFLCDRTLPDVSTKACQAIAGFRLYAMLSVQSAPEPFAVSELISGLADTDMKRQVGLGLLCVALSTGDTGIIVAAINKITRSEILQRDNILMHAHAFLRLTLSRLGVVDTAPDQILEDYANRMPDRLRARLQREAQGVVQLKRIWHQPDEIPVLSVKWIYRCFVYADG